MVAGKAPVRRLLRIAAIGLAFATPLATPAATQATAQIATQASDASQEARLAALLAMPFAGEMVGARDMPRFAWVTNIAGVRNIWIADNDDPGRPLTRFEGDDGTELYDLAFSPDGNRLAYVRGGDPEFPNAAVPNSGSAAFARPQEVFVQSISRGGEAAAIGAGHSPIFSPDGRWLAFARGGELWLRKGDAKAERVAKVMGTLADLSWSADGSHLLFTDDRGDHSFVGLFAPGSARIDYIDPGFGHAAEPIFSPDGTRIAFIRYTAPPPGEEEAESASLWSIATADVATRAVNTVWAAPAGAGSHYAGTRARNLYWAAADKLVFPWEQSGWLHAYAVPVAGGTAEELTPGAFEVETFLVDGTGQVLIYSANVDDPDRRHLWQRLLSGGEPTRLTHGEGIESQPVFAGGMLGAIVADARHPPRPARVARDGVLTILGPSEDAFAPARDFVVPEAVSFRAEDGLLIHAQRFPASGVAEGAERPGLIFVHGGPRRQMLLGFHQYRYYSNSYIMNQHLAAQGYEVLSINYRGGTGYGRAFREAPGTGRAGASEYRDVRAAGRWLADRSEVDPDRIGIWGGSWGGYLTALALARDSERFAAGVDLHGVHSLLRDPPRSLSPEEQDAARERMWDASPIASLDRWRSPVLLIAGDDDRNVDFSQSVLLARELAARGIPHESLVFANERHDFLRHESWLRAYLASARFLDRYLKEVRP